MADNKQRIKDLEEEIRKTKYNKATQGHIGILKAKIALLKDKEQQRQSGKGGTTEGFSVRKSGDGTVLLLGFPSTGKSTLLNTLTGADREVGAYAFTTLSVIPGMLYHRQAKIQILDVPGIIEGAARGKGRGREILSVVHNADLVLIVVDALQPQQYQAILKEVRDANIRVNQQKPEVYITKKGFGGIDIHTTVPLPLEKKVYARILQEFKLMNADVLIRTPIDADQLIDCIENNKKYVPALTIVTKCDLVTDEQLAEVKKQVPFDLAISAHTGLNIETLREAVFNKLNFMRLYMKEPRKPADMDEPFIIQEGSTIEDVCSKLHKDFVKKFRFARVWGKSAKFPGQRLMLHHKLTDGDVLEIHIR